MSGAGSREQQRVHHGLEGRLHRVFANAAHVPTAVHERRADPFSPPNEGSGEQQDQ